MHICIQICAYMFVHVCAYTHEFTYIDKYIYMCVLICATCTCYLFLTGQTCFHLIRARKVLQLSELTALAEGTSAPVQEGRAATWIVRLGLGWVLGSRSSNIKSSGATSIEIH